MDKNQNKENSLNAVQVELFSETKVDTAALNNSLESAFQSLETNQNNSNEFKNIPLAEWARPKTLLEIQGQDHILKGPIQKFLKAQFLPNLIFYGPPGVGKTSLARLLSRHFQYSFIEVSAVDTGARELRNLAQNCEKHWSEGKSKTILFVDEIHRLNTAQQDVLLPFAERGALVLLGATTENPRYAINSALLSRSHVLEFKPIPNSVMTKIMENTLLSLGYNLKDVISPEVVSFLTDGAEGDLRRLLNMLDSCFHSFLINKEKIHPKDLSELFAEKFVFSSKAENTSDLTSALIKSVRGSDPNAGMYYLVRLLAAGTDPLYISRRMLILASEDVGNADPVALTMALNVFKTVEVLGLPEAEIPLAQLVCYLSCCPKSNKSYRALMSAKEFLQKDFKKPIPNFLRLSANLDAKSAYKYPHDFPKFWVDQSYLDPSLGYPEFYKPSQSGREKYLADYLKWLKSNS